MLIVFLQNMSKKKTKIELVEIYAKMCRMVLPLETHCGSFLIHTSFTQNWFIFVYNFHYVLFSQ